MTLVKHELRQGRVSFCVWTAAIGFLLAICVFLFPEMKAQMAVFNKLFASMGAFTAAFGLDKLNFGTLLGYYAIECGNVLGLGGACFASLCAVGMLAKEERDRTAEFLLTHPVSRARIIAQKLLAVLIQITAMNLAVYVLSLASIAAIGEEIPWSSLSLIHLGYYLMQMELAAICFGISAFVRKGGAGIGLGLAVVLYFLNLIANIAKPAAFLGYVTPFGYCDGAQIISGGGLDGVKLAIGAAAGAAGVALAFAKYTRKDIR